VIGYGSSMSLRAHAFHRKLRFAHLLASYELMFHAEHRCSTASTRISIKLLRFAEAHVSRSSSFAILQPLRIA
jgi:hypothetical protein